MDNYECPSIDMKVKGNGVHEATKTSTFYYTVHTCDVINKVRETLNEPIVACKNASARDKVLNKLYVGSKIFYKVFDPTVQA